MKLTLYFHFLLVALGGAAIGLKSINLWYRPGRWKLCLSKRSDGRIETKTDGFTLPDGRSSLMD